MQRIFKFLYYCAPAKDLLASFQTIDNFILQQVALNAAVFTELVAISNNSGFQQLLDRGDLIVPELPQRILAKAITNERSGLEVVVSLIYIQPETLILTTILSIGARTAPNSPGRMAFMLLLRHNILEAIEMPNMLLAAKQKWLFVQDCRLIASIVLLFLQNFLQNYASDNFPGLSKDID